VLRGSAWTGNPGIARSAARAGMLAASRRDFIGFRVARAVDP
jgi:formylglycine-generating enzyme required for sulfatase activity